MKKKIGEIYNIPVVIGNKNEVTKNEVHIDELSAERSEDNLSKVERAFIIDFNKSVDSTITSQYEEFIQSNYIYFSTILQTSTNLDRKMIYDCYSVTTMSRPHFVVGFTINLYSKNVPSNLIDIANDFMIEIPIDIYYNLSNEKRLYNMERSFTIKQQATIIKEILDSFNLKNGESKDLTGYLIPGVSVADSASYIMNATKDSSSVYTLIELLDARSTETHLTDYLN